MCLGESLDNLDYEYYLLLLFASLFRGRATYFDCSAFTRLDFSDAPLCPSQSLSYLTERGAQGEEPPFQNASC
ncbi:hypothetical protein CLV24_1557 [Pontibacter ummariensis]|uniref:Uncharacterized protein n=1 Tax=Pontibacter ummariensis TaxID=1610492 RepID=A0A239LYF6_9BACT|nr:hypothetical protein CLV24_1557 [Pontibacter ummariensis]SNT34729.1 hypothetical protein SAMN06296052_1557 [Pontibacter ummariensis]